MPPGQKPPPDARFAMLFLFNWTVPVGIFIIAFCSYAHLHWFGDMVGMFLFSFGTILTFTGLIRALHPNQLLIRLRAPEADTVPACSIHGRPVPATSCICPRCTGLFASDTGRSFPAIQHANVSRSGRPGRVITARWHRGHSDTHAFHLQKYVAGSPLQVAVQR